VFWVEAFNEAVQKWIPIDPLVTKSLAKPSKFEPPASDPYNNMSYVVAFEDDASARDVTRRYTKAFNAKTRKSRVEITRNGEKWWNDALMAYEKPFLEDRDEAEISELTSKSAAEPMPRNIQDFKDHPVYALERHLRRNEVIFPKRVIGHVGLSKTTSKSDNLETVYRRSDVHLVRTLCRVPDRNLSTASCGTGKNSEECIWEFGYLRAQHGPTWSSPHQTPRGSPICQNPGH
jgi:xeroderma pigmentosum group C-complementing protein